MIRMSINHHFPRFNHEHTIAGATERRAELQRDIAAFLKAGGKIQTIPTGLSGHTKGGHTKDFLQRLEKAKQRSAKAN
jgi:hypothetical protein